MKVKILLVLGLLSDLEIFLDYKRYYLNNVIYIQIMFKALGICKTIKVPVIKYHAENPKNNMSFLI